MKQTKTIDLGSAGITFETGQIAKQANGSCLVRSGDTVVLATACMSGDPTVPRPFLPLTVDYRENAYAAGRIPGGFFKREGRPSEKEILTCRMIDRPVRPLFPEGYFGDTQIIAFVMSADGEHDPDVLAINGASAALTLSNIPFYNPIGAVRVGLIDDEIVFNPGNSERDVSELDLIVVGTEDAIVMVEAGANQLSEDIILDCIFKGHDELQKSIRAQHEMFRAAGLSKPVWETPQKYSPEAYDHARNAIYADLRQALNTTGKFEQKDAVDGVVKPYLAQFEGDEERVTQIKKAIKDFEEELLAEAVLEKGRRFDGRSTDEIRDITIDLGKMPRTHGSAVFTRGETQALVTATLGTRRDGQIVEGYEGEALQKFMLHYNFPPFCVGEVRFLRGPSRREIGHGNLARRALMPVLPHEDDFPYTVRLVSDILESNGSSSMASVCGGSLAMFDVGMPLLAPVAGVAMGLIKREERFAILSDIAGQEDHYGDMDFKVTGTKEGVTALQMDIKIGGVSREIMGAALEQARHGRLHILDCMQQAIAEPRAEISGLAPRLFTVQISRDKIRDIIGPGGKTIRSIQEETGCEIEIENDGKVIVAAPDGTAAKRALEIIEQITEVPEVGKTYNGLVTRVESFGAFVEILPGTEGLLHVSELAPYRVREVTDLVREGDQVEVKVLEIDPERGKIRLSRKAVLLEDPNYEPTEEELALAASAPSGGGDGGGRGGRGRPGGGRGGRPGGRGGRPGGGRRVTDRCHSSRDQSMHEGPANTLVPV